MSRGNLAHSQAYVDFDHHDYKSAIRNLRIAQHEYPQNDPAQPALAKELRVASERSNSARSAESAPAAQRNGTGTVQSSQGRPRTSQGAGSGYADSEHAGSAGGQFNSTAQRYHSGSNTNAGDQVKTVAATGVGFDSSAGPSKGHLNTFKKTDFIEVDRIPNVPRNFQNNAVIQGFEKERVAAQAERKKAEAEVQQIKVAMAKPGANKGRLEVELAEADKKATTSASRENAARINEEEKAKQLEDQSVSAAMGNIQNKQKPKEPPPPQTRGDNR